MAQGAWRCSQCGTINEPVANSCRTCGKWPSLFDLEDSVVDEAEYAELSEAEPEPEPTSFEPTTVEAPVFEPPPPAVPVPQHMEPEPEVYEDLGDEAEEPPRRRWTSAIIPIAVLIYFVISAIADRG
jgi:hypothetical protein